MDDIPFENTASETAREPDQPASADEAPKPRRRVGPESEVRGGPEAPAPPKPER